MSDVHILVPKWTAIELGWTQNMPRGTPLLGVNFPGGIPAVHPLWSDGVDPVEIVFEYSMDLDYVQLRVSGPGLAEPSDCLAVEAIFDYLTGNRPDVIGPIPASGGQMPARCTPQGLAQRADEMEWKVLFTELLWFAAHDRTASFFVLALFPALGPDGGRLDGFGSRNFGRRATSLPADVIQHLIAMQQLRGDTAHSQWARMKSQARSRAILAYFDNVRLPAWGRGLTKPQLCAIAGLLESDMTITYKNGKLILKLKNTDLALILRFRAIVLIDEQDVLPVYERNSTGGRKLTLFHNAVNYDTRRAPYEVELTNEVQNM